MPFRGIGGRYHVLFRADVHIIAAGRTVDILVDVIHWHLQILVGVGWSGGVAQEGIAAMMAALAGLLIEGQVCHIADGGLQFRDVVASVVPVADILQRVAVRHILLAGVGSAFKDDGGVVQPQAVGALNGLEGLGGVTTLYAAVVAHLNLAVQVAAQHRGAAAVDRTHQVHLGIRGDEVVGCVVPFAIDIQTALAAKESGVVEGGRAAGVTPVGTAIHRGLEVNGVDGECLAEAAAVAGLEALVGAVLRVGAIAVLPHRAAVYGLLADVHIG